MASPAPRSLRRTDSPQSTSAPSSSSWASWPRRRAGKPTFTVGVEEELMLVSPGGWDLAQVADKMLPQFESVLQSQISSETHAGAIEIETAVHANVPDTIRELRLLRDVVRAAAHDNEIEVAASGTHPFTVWSDTVVAGGDRHAAVYGAMRELARREPTYAVHVHVGLPDPDSAIAVFNRMRAHLPMLLALSANSPFWQGRDTGLASTRTPLFQAFPRVGIPRRFDDYGEWVRAVETLVHCGALPDPSYLWWDVRLQPRYGTIEVRIMDAQIDLESTAALVALVQSLVVMEHERAWAEEASHAPQEIWEENRFIAARDGHHAQLIVATEGIRVPLADRLSVLMPHLREHATDLGCAAELASCATLLARPGAQRQRQIAGYAAQLPRLVEGLVRAY